MVQHHPVLAYYVLAFAISWGGLFLAAGGPSGFPATDEQVARLMPLVIAVTYAGPFAAGLLLTGLLEGRAGYRELLGRLLRWRVGVRWYAVALLTAPLVFLATALALALVSPSYLPGIFTAADKLSILAIGILPAPLVGLCEEVGWTGFAIPRLRQTHGVLATGLIVGVLWGAWHVPAMALWAGAATAGGMPLAVFMVMRSLDLLVGQLLVYRVLMVWVYDRTGSLLMGVLMHTGLVAATWILAGAGAGLPMFIGGWAVTLVLWGIVGTIAAATHGQLAGARSH